MLFARNEKKIRNNSTLLTPALQLVREGIFGISVPIIPTSVKCRLALSVLFSFLAGCSSNVDVFSPHRVNYHHESGSTHIAVSFIAPWEEFIDILEPNFEMTAEKALKSVIPNVLLLEEKRLDAFQAEFKIAPPRTSVTELSVEKQAGSSPPARTTEITEKREPGDVSTIGGKTSALSGRKASELPGISSFTEGIGIDPMLQHWAALSLFQEVKLLNRLVQNVALRHGYRPYVVRLQVSALPAARNQPYDAYATFSFFNDDDETSQSVAVPKSSVPSDGQNAKPETSPQKPVPQAPPDIEPPLVIPLLVTDNLQAAIHSGSLDVLRNVAGGLSALIQGFATSAEVQRLTDELKSVLGKNLNSLLTVARVSDNTLRVRLGAHDDPGSRYSMVPRTHNITVLLLVSNKYKGNSLHVVSKTSMVDAESGQTLKLRPREQVVQAIYNAIESANLPFDTRGMDSNTFLRQAYKLIFAAQRNDYGGFVKILKELKWETDYAETLWLELISLMVGNPYAVATFQLPNQQTPSIPENQLLLIEDDLENHATVTVRGGRGLNSNRMVAGLVVADREEIIAERVRVQDGGKQVTIVFPSPAALGLLHKGDGSDLRLKLMLETGPWNEHEGASQKSPTWNFFKVAYKKKTKPENLGFSVSVTTATVVADKDGKGTIQVHVSLKPKGGKEISLSLAGADLESFSVDPSDAAQRKGPKLVVYKDCILTLKLANLTPAAPLVLSAVNESGMSHDSIARSVIVATK